MSVEINIDPAHRLDALVFEVEAMAERADDMSPVFEVIVDKIMQRNRRGFESRGATTGKYWAPLRNNTIASKRAHSFLHPDSPLRATDDLMRSLSEPGAPGQILEINDSDFTFGTTIPYADFHQTGFTHHKTGRHVPARPPMTIAKKHMQEYIKDIRDWVFEGEL